MASHETVDVVIAGAGASGSTFAAVLALSTPLIAAR